MVEKFNAKLSGNSYIDRIEINNINLGDSCPLVNGVRVLKIISPDQSVSFEIDVSYEGGAAIDLSAVLPSGLLVDLIFKERLFLFESHSRNSTQFQSVYESLL